MKNLLDKSTYFLTFFLSMCVLAIGCDEPKSSSTSSASSRNVPREVCVYNDRIGQSFTSCIGADRGNYHAVMACCNRLDANREMFFGDSADSITSLSMTSDGKCELCASR